MKLLINLCNIGIYEYLYVKNLMICWELKYNKTARRHLLRDISHWQLDAKQKNQTYCLIQPKVP